MIKKIFSVLTRREKTLVVLALVAAAVNGFIVSGLRYSEATHPVPAVGGEYTEGRLGQPVYVNPVIAASDADKTLVRLVFGNLGESADKIESSADGRTWKIRLKENLRWQDGEKLTSDDVIFTVQKIQDKDTNSPLSPSWQGVASQRLSELELQFSLVNAYAFFGDTIANLYILPKHLFADVPASNWRLSDYNFSPVGSGPYKFFGYEKRADGFIESYKLASWDGYAGAKPLIENFNFRFFADKGALLQNFNSGQIDGAAGLEAEDLLQIKRPYETAAFRLPDYYAVFFNQSRSVPLQDAAARKALGLAVTRDDLVAEALGGRGKPAFGPIPRDTPYFDAAIASGTFSAEAASGTLDEAGWKMDGASGMREKTVGTTKVPLQLTLTVPQIGLLQKTADFLQKTWTAAGFKINLVAETPDDVAQIAVKNRDYEMLLYGNRLGGSFDLYSFWHSSQRFYPGENLSLYNSKKADGLMESIRQELDGKKRLNEFYELQETIAGDSPAVFLYSPDYLYISQKNLHGVDGGFVAEPADIYAGARNWYLKTARVLR